MPGGLPNFIPQVTLAFLNDEVQPPTIQGLSHTIGEDLLDVGVGEHLQPIRIVKSLLNVQITPLEVLHFDVTPSINFGLNYLLEFVLLKVVYDCLSDLTDLFSRL